MKRCKTGVQNCELCNKMTSALSSAFLSEALSTAAIGSSTARLYFFGPLTKVKCCGRMERCRANQHPLSIHILIADVFVKGVFLPL